jgi:hypothetical protein
MAWHNLVKVTTPSGRKTGELNWRTSENPNVIASIEAPMKSDVWRSKIVIFNTRTTFFWKQILALRQPLVEYPGFSNWFTIGDFAKCDPIPQKRSP